MKRFVVALATVGLTLLFFSAPADAHAVLESVEPASGSVSATAPTTVELRFNEPVEAPAGSVRCFDANGKTLGVGAPRVRGTEVSTSIKSRLANGGYVCTWRVTSADGHAITGATNFTVGSQADPDLGALSGQLLDRVTNDPTVSTLLSVASGITYAGIALLIGPAFFVAVFASGWRVRPRLRMLVALGWLATLVGSAATLLLDGPYVEGRGLDAVFDGAALQTSLDGRVGHAALARIVVTALALIVIRVLESPFALPRWWRPSAAALAVLIATSIGASGHSAVGSFTWFWIPVATVHVLAMAIWLGGLALLVAEALPGGERPDDLATGLRRFSPVATVAVVVIACTGVLQAWREVGSADALLTTRYGAVLLAKVAAFALALTVAAVVRQRALAPTVDGVGSAARVDEEVAPDHIEAPATPTAATTTTTTTATTATTTRAPSTRTALAVECAFVVVALALTAVLTATPPAEVEYAQRGSTAYIATDTLDFDVSLTRATATGRQLHLLIIDHATGQQTGVDAVSAQWTQGDLGPFDAKLTELAPGHYIVDSVQLPASGKWTLTLRTRRGNFDETVGVARLNVG